MGTASYLASGGVDAAGLTTILPCAWYTSPPISPPPVLT